MLNALLSYRWVSSSMTKTMTMISCGFLLLLGGCSAAVNNYSKAAAGMLSGDYKVTVWSGDQAVAVYNVEDSFVNAGENGGWFFFVSGKLVRVSGTVTVEQQ